MEPTLNESLLEGDVLVEELREAAKTATPEKRLMVAILEEAYREATHWGTRSWIRGPYKCSPIEELRAWFSGKSDRYIFSFTSICDALGISQTRARAHGLRLTG